MLALALAFVGPIGDVLRVEQVTIQLFGDPGSGKTAVFIPAGSVWGLHTTSERAINHGFGETWKNTANNLDPIAVAHNHTLLPLEETRTADKSKKLQVEAITDVAMRLEKAVEKGRLTDTTPPRSWWVPILSTSNLPLDHMAASSDFRVDDAHRGRLIDVPLPSSGHGIFEDLHGDPDHAAFSQALEPYRVFRRLLILEGWSHDQAYTPVFS